MALPSFGWYLLSLPLYLTLFWVSALPWSPLLLIQRKKLFVEAKADGTDGYLLINIAMIFLVFSLMVTKLPHYTLPAFPFIALFFARRWMAAGLSPGLPIKLTVGFGVAFALIRRGCSFPWRWRTMPRPPRWDNWSGRPSLRQKSGQEQVPSPATHGSESDVAMPEGAIT